MRFAIDWLDHAPNAAPEERATACDLRIWVGDVNVTEHLAEGQRTAVDHVTISAYPLAEGLVHDWWAIFGARDQVYRLTRHRMGFALPEICLQCNGRYLEITTPQRPYGNPRVRFWSAPPVVVTRADAEGALAFFVEKVIDRLEAEKIRGTGAQLRWHRVGESRRDPDEQLFCECAGALGVDPYQLDEEIATLVEEAGTLFTGEPLIEFLAGIRHVAGRSMSLDWIRRAEQRPEKHSLLPDLAALAKAVANDSVGQSSGRAFELGYRRARAVRAELSMPGHERVASTAALAQKLGSRSFSIFDPVQGLRATVIERTLGASINLAGTPLPSSELFNFGRAMGQFVCFPTRERAAVNNLSSAYEQAAGRSFAAEFLAPIDEIRNMIADGKYVDEIAAAFGVSEKVIDHQIENAERIDAAVSAAA